MVVDKKGLPFTWQTGNDSAYIMNKTHIKHPGGFVQNEIPDINQ